MQGHFLWLKGKRGRDTILSWIPRKNQRRLPCNVKVRLIKLEGGTAAHLRRLHRRRAGEARPKGKMKNRPGGVYSEPNDSSFSLPRGSSAAFQVNCLDFYVTHRFFVAFFPEESNVFPSSLPLVNPLHSTQPSPRPAPAPSGHSAYRRSSAIATWAHPGCWDADRTPSATRQPVDPDTATR